MPDSTSDVSTLRKTGSTQYNRHETIHSHARTNRPPSRSSSPNRTT
ncbi:MAG: hypothetical protein ACTJLK_01005 [Anaplasma sp.]